MTIKGWEAAFLDEDTCARYLVRHRWSTVIRCPRCGSVNVGAVSRDPKQLPHDAVNHSKREYVVGTVHTNTIEGFWSLVKRGVAGTYHKVSRKYLPLYVAEFRFRYNNRSNPDIFGAAIKGC